MPFERKDKATGENKPHLQVVIEKKSMINLVRVANVGSGLPLTRTLFDRCKPTQFL